MTLSGLTILTVVTVPLAHCIVPIPSVLRPIPPVYRNADVFASNLIEVINYNSPREAPVGRFANDTYPGMNGRNASTNYEMIVTICDSIADTCSSRESPE